MQLKVPAIEGWIFPYYRIACRVKRQMKRDVRATPFKVDGPIIYMDFIIWFS